MDTFGSDFDTGLAIYTGMCDALTEVACNDDFGGVTSQITMPTTAGTTYFILAGGYGSDAGNLVLHLNHYTPPAFSVQPTNISVVVSSNAIFNPSLSGTLPMTFQWFFNNSPLVDGGRISGSTNSTLIIANVQTNDGGNYFLVASNWVGVTTSSVAVLTPIILPPTITTPPVSQSILVGSNVNFFAGVDGTPPCNYQWSLNGNPLTDDGVHIGEKGLEQQLAWKQKLVGDLEVEERKLTPIERAVKAATEGWREHFEQAPNLSEELARVRQLPPVAVRVERQHCETQYN